MLNCGETSGVSSSGASTAGGGGGAGATGGCRGVCRDAWEDSRAGRRCGEFGGAGAPEGGRAIWVGAPGAGSGSPLGAATGLGCGADACAPGSSGGSGFMILTGGIEAGDG